MKLKRGLVQIYTGNGKGKTTASFGLALRAAGAGLKVYIGQFIKAEAYSEIKTLKRIKNIKVEQYGRGCFIKRKPETIDMERAEKGLSKARKNIMSGKYNVVILDEVTIALNLGMVKTKDIVNTIKRKPHSVELILTGRYCPPILFRYADLVTEMKEIKHPYRKGIKARRGIEF